MSNEIKHQDAEKQGMNEVGKDKKRAIIEDGITTKKNTQVTSNEKEAAYKHENGNPQANRTTSVVNKQGEERHEPVDNPKQEIGSDG